MPDQTQVVNSDNRVFKFLENLANSSSEITDIERKIIQLKIRRQLMDSIKKIKQTMKRYTDEGG
jgi:hypothetical protein